MVNFEIIDKKPNYLPDCDITTTLKFYTKSHKRGTIFLSDLKKSFKEIQHDNSVIVFSHAISIMFQIFDHYFMQCSCLETGFDFEHLLTAIQEVGLHAIEWDLEEHPEHYKKTISPEEFLKKCKIQSGNIRLTGNCVYVEVKL